MTLEEFEKTYQHFDMVNYDIASAFGDEGYGLVYKTDSNIKGKCERLRKDNSNKYITYPYIQPYITSMNSNKSLFIIYDGSVYKLRPSIKENTYEIEYKLDNVDPIIFDRIFYGGYKLAQDPRIQDEPIYKIENN